MYEGRTRGKRLRYTYSDEGEVDDSESAENNRRSTRTSGVATPADPSRPTITASGRQVKSRMGGMYGERLLSSHADIDGASATETYSDASEQPGRPTRASRRAEPNGRGKPRKHIEGYNSLDELDDEDDAMSSGHDWDAGDEDDVDDNLIDDDDDEMSDGSEDEDLEPKSLVITLRYRKPEIAHTQPTITDIPQAVQSLPTPTTELPNSKEDGSVQPVNGAPLRSKMLQVPPAGQPAPGLSEIHHDPPMNASSIPGAAPPGMLAVVPASASPPDASPPTIPQYHTQSGFDIHKTVPSPAPVSTL